ncbi:fumble-domain-containing protein [Ochromonadaceae sp. CCMP2298]|nr:fumble-domain-containing protein [Ochromonadaceae sp. CCMP2298]
MEARSRTIVIVAATLSLVAIAVAAALFQKKRRADHTRQSRRRKKVGSVNIGGIFGMDVGGTLTKIVYFEAKREGLSSRAGSCEFDERGDSNGTGPGLTGASLGSRGGASDVPGMVKRQSSDSLAQLECPDHQAALEKLYTFMDNNSRSSGKGSVARDDELSLYSSLLEGKLHFLHFETRNMMDSIKNVASTALIDNIRTIGCTGGGAHKFSGDFDDQLGITINKFDELECLVRGMHFALNNFQDECFTYRKEDKEEEAEAGGGGQSSSGGKASTAKEDAGEPRTDAKDKDYTRLVYLPCDSDSLSAFPYLCVNIGSGVSILKVTGPGRAERVSGTSLGGGTYWGLCRLLTSCNTYEEVLNYAEQGNANVVDMLVKDIYGGDYTSTLSGTTVASSFGKLVTKENPREGVREEDLALALLMMITNNIGQVAYLTAQLQKCSKIFFVGSFLRQNPISCRRLSFAINFWSKGAMEALFLTHEGYFGALGTFLTSAFADEVDKVINIRNVSTANGKKKTSTDADAAAGAGERRKSAGASYVDKSSENSSKSAGVTGSVAAVLGAAVLGAGAPVVSAPDIDYALDYTDEEVTTSRRGRSFSADSKTPPKSKAFHTHGTEALNT